MTDPKLPPLPEGAAGKDYGPNGDQKYCAERMNAHWLDGYRAGQSSAKALTEAGVDLLNSLQECSEEYRNSSPPATAPKGGQEP